MGRWYAAADCLVLPSQKGAGETWGLVVNEALHFGLPVIASDGVGCHPDLIPDQHTGRVFPSGDARAFARHLNELADELPGRRGDYAARAAMRIENFTLEKVVEGLIKLIQRAADPSGT
jgi:glycosyltransferase involved in cell wall biosynthesis